MKEYKMDMKEERNMILDMIAEGKITVEEAKQLLDALEQGAEGEDIPDDYFDPQIFDTSFNNMRLPYIPNIINKSTRKAFRHAYHRMDMDSAMDGLENAREDLEDELQRMREELKDLHKEADRMRKEKDKD
jgi:polyhydroxyalkanoate synthesis regulator phasin